MSDVAFFITAGGMSALEGEADMSAAYFMSTGRHLSRSWPLLAALEPRSAAPAVTQLPVTPQRLKALLADGSTVVS